MSETVCKYFLGNVNLTAVLRAPRLLLVRRIAFTLLIYLSFMDSPCVWHGRCVIWTTLALVLGVLGFIIIPKSGGSDELFKLSTYWFAFRRCLGG